MIRSMTGFGSADVYFEFGEIIAEVRSVNNRFLDVNVRLPRDFVAVESVVRDVAKQRVQRGKCDISLRWIASKEIEKPSVVNTEVLQGYFESIKNTMGEKFALASAGAMLRMPGVCETEEQQGGQKFSEEILEQVKSALIRALQEALDCFNESREAEGARLREDLAARLVRVGELCSAMMMEREKVMADFVARLRDKAADFAARSSVEFDNNRLEMEIVLFADRCDICEELVRLRSHIQAFTEYLNPAKDVLVGKSLDFLVQELLREATTASNKCRSVESSALCVELKTEIEKIREQVQNIA